MASGVAGRKGRATLPVHVIVLHGFRTKSTYRKITFLGSSGSIETNLPAILLLMKAVNAMTARVRDEAALTSQRVNDLLSGDEDNS